MRVECGRDARRCSLRGKRVQSEDSASPGKLGGCNRGENRAIKTLRTTLKRGLETVPVYRRFSHDSSMLYRNGTRNDGFEAWIRGRTLSISPPLTVIIVLCTTFCIYIFARYKTPEEITDEGYIRKFGVEGKGVGRMMIVSFLPLVEGIFFRGGGATPKREKIEWKFIVGQPMLMLRARGKIEIRLHFRESWRVGGSTGARGFLLEGRRGGLRVY